MYAHRLCGDRVRQQTQHCRPELRATRQIPSAPLASSVKPDWCGNGDGKAATTVEIGAYNRSDRTGPFAPAPRRDFEGPLGPMIHCGRFESVFLTRRVDRRTCGKELNSLAKADALCRHVPFNDVAVRAA